MARSLRGCKRWIALLMCNILAIIIMFTIIGNENNKCNETRRECELSSRDGKTCILSIDTDNKTVSCGLTTCNLEADESESVDCYYKEKDMCPTRGCYEAYAIGYIAFTSFIFLVEIVYLVFLCYKNYKNNGSDDDLELGQKPKELHPGTIFVE